MDKPQLPETLKDCSLVMYRQGSQNELHAMIETGGKTVAMVSADGGFSMFPHFTDDENLVKAVIEFSHMFVAYAKENRYWIIPWGTNRKGTEISSNAWSMRSNGNFKVEEVWTDGWKTAPIFWFTDKQLKELEDSQPDSVVTAIEILKQEVSHDDEDF